MSDGDRGKFDYVGLLAFLAIALPLYAAMIWDLSAQETRNEIEATYAARDYAESTDGQIRDLCVGSSLQSRVECAKEIIAANRESERGERDLEAQQSMARWTLIMGVVAGAGLLISLIGVVLVYITFRETRRAADAGFRANEIAQESSQRQLRPYVHIEGMKPERPKSGMKDISITIKNFGHTPAENIRTAFSWCYCPASQDRWSLPGARVTLDRGIPPGHIQTATIGPTDEEDWSQEVEYVRQGLGEFRVVLVVTYEGYGIDGEDTFRALIRFGKNGPHVAVRETEGPVTNT